MARLLSSYTRKEIFEYGVEKSEELKHKVGQQTPEKSGAGKFAPSRNSSHTRRSSNDPQLMKMRRRLSHEIRRSLRGSQSEMRLREGIRRRHTNDFPPIHMCNPVENSPGEISLEGLDATISDLLGGIGEYSTEDVRNLFHRVDFDGSGHIDEAKLNSFFDVLDNDKDTEIIDKVERGMERSRSSRSSLTSFVSTAEEQAELLWGGNQAIEHLLELSRGEDDILKYWSIFYCGKNAKIESDLRATTKKYGIGDLAVERFKW